MLHATQVAERIFEAIRLFNVQYTHKNFIYHSSRVERHYSTRRCLGNICYFNGGLEALSSLCVQHHIDGQIEKDAKTKSTE